MKPEAWARTFTWMVLALVIFALTACAHAADDTVRFYGVWITNVDYNGQSVIVESVHDGSGYKNYVRLPASVTPAGNGSFSAANGKWAAAAAAPDNSGTYKFTNDYTITGTNSAGQAVIWRTSDDPLPSGIAPPNYQQLMAAYLQAANAGATWAMSDMGDLYAYGHGVAIDYNQAMGWYQKAAAGGDMAAMNLIGLSYDKGLGVPLDYKQAMAWYSKAAAAGDNEAMGNIGALYADGLGVAKDYQQAMTWYQKGAAAGSAEAMYNIGFAYYSGQGVAKDYQQAMAWYLKSANAGFPLAMEQIAYLYTTAWVFQPTGIWDSHGIAWLLQRGMHHRSNG